METLNELVNNIINNQYFVIVIVVLLLVLLVIVSYLLKLQSYSKKFKEEKEELEEKDILDIEKEPIIIEEKVEEPTIFDMDAIDKFESDEEETAIISAEELSNAKEDRVNTLGIESNQELIDYYEEEQEKKAIISYEDLLNNASNIKINYIEEPIIENGPVVRKVEFENSKISESKYKENEEFLRLLKEFSLNIK